MSILWDSNNGTAYRSGARNQLPLYTSFAPILRERARMNAPSNPVKPRLSRKGRPISGTLPRLAGRW